MDESISGHYKGIPEGYPDRLFAYNNVDFELQTCLFC